MEATIEGEAHRFYGVVPSDLGGLGKRTPDWDLNDWKWDGDLFLATRLNSAPSNCGGTQVFPLGSGIQDTGGSSNSSSSCSDEVNVGSGNRKTDWEKRRRVIVVEDDVDDEAGDLTLKLGGHGYPGARGDVGNWEVTGSKKSKSSGGALTRSVCQVEDCGADLSKAKDYHRRHKVCEMHSKASKALVGNVLQRFCQQCSRFHILQEFDDGKRSCRRRLAGHNRRRRKTQPDTAANVSSQNDEQATGVLLMSLLRILSNIHANGSDPTKDQDLLSNILKNLACHAGSHEGRDVSQLLHESQHMLNNGTSLGNPEQVLAFLTKSARGAPGPMKQHVASPASNVPQNGIFVDCARDEVVPPTYSTKPCILLPIEETHPASSEVRGSNTGRAKLSDFDLNDVYIDSDYGVDESDQSLIPTNLGTGLVECPSWVRQDSRQSSPPQTSGNSDSASALSPSSSSGDNQSRTDRIVFKLFGKKPNDFPVLLRSQILDWLSHSPTDIESYIRPGCIVLTIYLCLDESIWEELCHELSSSLSRLLDSTDDNFWKTGWMYIRVPDQVAFVYNGQIVLNATLPGIDDDQCIISIRPIATPVSERAHFSVKGFNLYQPGTRLLCSLDGNYLFQEAAHELLNNVGSLKEPGRLQCLSFSFSVPAVSGRGFIEVEDDGVSSGFFPFIIAENDVCSEIRMLESVLDLIEIDESDGEITGAMEAYRQAMDFIHEMGWLLHRNNLKSRLEYLDNNKIVFPFKRFRWLMEFSLDHDWCAVVKKLLDILIDGTVDTGEYPSVNLAISDMGLLHKAVRRNCRPLVELLLGYIPQKTLDDLGSGQNLTIVGENDRYLFRPDVLGPACLTPLHIAAGKDGSEGVLDALTNDPGMVGIEAWKVARDATGFTPEDYARLRGHYSYIHLVQRKVGKKPSIGHVVLDIPRYLSGSNMNQKQKDEATSSVVPGFQIGVSDLRPDQKQCGLCHQKLGYGRARRSLLYRPAMVSMVAIAAVCVCVALLFKSQPEVLYVFRPFRWELLEYGSS
ncbi:SBP domain [Dillenia turbinata]|uniref:SBP domain n=1 Tax=Dillenia turbinata TaxID=194707 RepID=A0AAN8VN80_9MAGN